MFSNTHIKKFGAMHFIYYINRSIATKVDLFGLLTNSTMRIYVLWRELGSNSWRLDHRADAFPLHHTCQQSSDNSGANYVSHISSYLDHYNFQNITPTNYNSLWSVYLGFNLFTYNGHHYNIVGSP